MGSTLNAAGRRVYYGASGTPRRAIPYQARLHKMEREIVVNAL